MKKALLPGVLAFLFIVSGCASDPPVTNIQSCIKSCETGDQICSSTCSFGCVATKAGYSYCYNSCMDKCEDNKNQCIGVCALEYPHY